MYCCMQSVLLVTFKPAPVHNALIYQSATYRYSWKISSTVSKCSYDITTVKRNVEQKFIYTMVFSLNFLCASSDKSGLWSLEKYECNRNLHIHLSDVNLTTSAKNIWQIVGATPTWSTMESPSHMIYCNLKKYHLMRAYKNSLFFPLSLRHEINILQRNLSQKITQAIGFSSQKQILSVLSAPFLIKSNLKIILHIITLLKNYYSSFSLPILVFSCYTCSSS